MVISPRAALIVVLGEGEHHRLAAAALAEKAIVVAVGRGPGNRDDGSSELLVEGSGPFAIVGFLRRHGGDIPVQKR